MKVSQFLFGLGVVLFLVSCEATPRKNHSSGAAIEHLEKDEMELFEEIANTDSALVISATAKEMSDLGVKQLEMCRNFLQYFPKSTKKPEVQLKAANACRAVGRSDEAVKYLREFTQANNDHPLRAEALFTLAFILDEDMQDKDGAKRAYTELISNYPNSPYKVNAEILVEQLYMSDAEIIESFKKKN